MNNHRATGLARTDRAVPYLKQVCRHFQHKVDVEFSDEAGLIRFPAATCALHPGEDALEVEIEAKAESDLERTKDVVKSHLDRFGRRDGLTLEWR